MGISPRMVRRPLYLAMAGVLVVTILGLNAGSSGADPGDPSERLDCGKPNAATKTGVVVTTMVTHDDVTVEKRSPAELAAAYTAGVSASRPTLAGQRQVAFQSDIRSDITVKNGSATVAVLLYERDSKLGWRLESVFECA